MWPVANNDGEVTTTLVSPNIFTEESPSIVMFEAFPMILVPESTKKIPLVVSNVILSDIVPPAACIVPLALILPVTVSFCDGAVVPIPTLPLFMAILVAPLWLKAKIGLPLPSDLYLIPASSSQPELSYAFILSTHSSWLPANVTGSTCRYPL